MNSRGLRRLPKGYARDSRRRTMVLNQDLNDTPPGEGRTQEGTSAGVNSQEVRTSEQGGALPTTTIDVEAIDDEVLISSPRRFAEARNKKRRNRAVTVLIDEDSDVHQACSDEPNTRLALNSYNKRRRVPPNQTIINCELCVNLEGNHNAKKKNNMEHHPVPPKSVPPPKEPTFRCPVCIGPLVEETSTKCGHIFCNKCIKTAITAQSKCPTCRRKLSMKDTVRIYLPATS